jgi:hypothetical protein
MSSDSQISILFSNHWRLNFLTFVDFFPAIAQTLEHFTKLQKKTYTKPEAADVTSLNLLYYICNFHFVVAIVIVQMCLAFKKGLSRSLQERSLDIGRALKGETLVLI